MITHTLPPLRHLLILGSCFSLTLSSSLAIDFLDDFEGTELSATNWVIGGTNNVTVAESSVTWEPEGDWGSGHIVTQARYSIPEADAITSIEWVLAPGTVITADPGEGRSLRYQFGIQSFNETSSDPQHWTNTSGGVWIDLDNIVLAELGTAQGNALSADDTKLVNTNATNLTGVGVDWNWQTESLTIRLDLTETGYTWYANDTAISGGSDEWAFANIDTEFDAGYRVLALGMNFSSARGTTGYERISITNGIPFESGKLDSFISNRSEVFAGQSFTLSWAIDPDATAASIDQEIGDILPLTSVGVGSVKVQAPDLGFEDTVSYTISVTSGGEILTRTVDVFVLDPPELAEGDFLDHFDEDDLDFDMWETRGPRNYFVDNSFVVFEEGGNNWDQAEINSFLAFPLPADGTVTTVSWELGPATATNTIDDENSDFDGRAVRPMLGIFSAFETDDSSRQHWQNTTGGIWFDIESLGANRTTGADGTVYYANDTKQTATNGTSVESFDIPDWTWETNNYPITLLLHNTGGEFTYEWFGSNRLTPLVTGSFADAGLDDEFSKGFKIMAMGGNADSGRGEVSFDQISVTNGPPVMIVAPEVSSFTPDFGSNQLSFTWTSVAGALYTIESTSTFQGSWTPVMTDIAGQAGSTTQMVPSTDSLALFYRVRQQ